MLYTKVDHSMGEFRVKLSGKLLACTLAIIYTVVAILEHKVHKWTFLVHDKKDLLLSTAETHKYYPLLASKTKNK